jgi:L-lactate dehydrogenase
MMNNHRRKVVIVGAGAVGSTFAYALAQRGLADEIVLIDRNESLARGQVLDLQHGQAFFPAVSIRYGGPSDYGDASLIVMTAGATQQPGETRMGLLAKNASIVRSVMADIMAAGSRAVVLVVSNPVDVMTAVAAKSVEEGAATRVLGSGTVLDSSRLRQILAARCGIDTHSMHGYVLGEHGDSEFVAWSLTHVAGVHINDYAPASGKFEDWPREREEIELQVRESAYHIIGYKGATWFAVGLALVRIAGAILRDERSVLTVAAMLDGPYGLRDVCLSVPCIVGARGVERVVECELEADELSRLTASADVLSKAVASVGD